MEDNKNNKELGLIDILQIVGQWIVLLVKKLTEWGLFLVFFGIKRWKYFVIAGALAGTYSYISYKIQDDQYEANMVIRSNAVESIQMKKFLDTYGNFIGNELLGDSIIEAKTGLDSVQRSYISSVSVFYCIDEDKDGIVDEVDRAGRFKSSDGKIDSLNLCVNVRFEDVSILPLLATNITNYINHIPYIIDRNNSRMSELLTRQSLLKGEIELLDTLQKRTYVGLDIANTLKAQNGNVLVDNRKVLVYRDKLELLDMLKDIQCNIEIYTEPVTIIEDFVIEKAAINSLSAIVKKNVVFVLFGVYFLLFLVFVYNKVKGKYLN